MVFLHVYRNGNSEQMTELPTEEQLASLGTLSMIGIFVLDDYNDFHKVLPNGDWELIPRLPVKKGGKSARKRQ